MSMFRYTAVGALALFAAFVTFAACSDRTDSAGSVSHVLAPDGASHTMGAGTTPTPLGRATFDDPERKDIHIKRETGDWRIDIKSKPSFDIAVQSITFEPGGHSGWHRHPGPVFIQVVSGTMTFYEADDPTCTPIVKTAGQGYVDLGEHGHIARNESGSQAKNVVTYFLPPGAPLKDDAPAPGNCPF